MPFPIGSTVVVVVWNGVSMSNRFRDFVL